MGVKGLWQLLDSTGSPVTLESLENKVLAVDVSIWLNQALKGYRDKEGNPIHNAHLLGLFQRVSKLLFYKIKPVFVFDGGVPYLKKQTLIARNQQKMKARAESSKIGKRILSNYLTAQAIGNQISEDSPKEQILNKISPKKIRTQDDDLYHLPPISTSNPNTSSDSEDGWEQIEQYRSAVFGSEYQSLDDIDMESSEFKNLPLEIRYEFLKDMKEMKKNRDFSRKRDLPEVAEDFSTFQMKKLLKKRKLQNEIEVVEKEMKTQSSGEAFSQLSQDNVNYGSSSYVSESSRVASDESTHVILLGKDKEKKIQNVKIAKSEKIIGHRYEIENRAKSLNSGVNFKNMAILTESGNESDEPDFTHDMAVATKHQMSESSGDEKDEKDHKLPLDLENYASSVDERKIDLSPNETEVDLPKTKIPENNGTSAELIVAPLNSKLIDDRNSKDDKTISDEHSTCTNESIKLSEIPMCSEKSEICKFSSSLPSTNQKEDRSNTIEVSDSDSDGFVEVEDGENKEIACVQLPNKKEIQINPVPSHSEVHVCKSFSESSEDSNDSTEISTISSGSLTVEPKPDQIKYSVEDFELKKANAEAENVVLIGEKARQERIAASVTDNMVIECQELLKLFGVPFVVSPMEAEAQCAKLDELQLTEGTITDDSDIWLFGGRYVYKNFFNQKRHVEGFKLIDIESLLGLQREQMINVAMLTGSDYTDGIEGVGPITAMEIIAEFPGKGLQPLVNFKKWWSNSKKMTTAPGNKIKAKLKTLALANNFPNPNVFSAYMEPEVDDSKEKFSWSMPDLDMLRQFAIQKFGWTKTKVDDILLPIMKKFNSSQTQMKLDRYLTFSLKKEKKVLPSKRLQNLLKKFNASSEPSTSNAAASKKSKKPNASPQKTRKGKSKPKLPVLSESKGSKKNNSSASKKIQKHGLNDANSRIIGMSEANSILESSKRNRSKTTAKILVANNDSFLSEESESE